jgi:hypothetical protein
VVSMRSSERPPPPSAETEVRPTEPLDPRQRF